MRRAKTAPLTFERECLAQGYHCVLGIDEAGRGAWAGPVSAGAVWLPLDQADLEKTLAGVFDSKQVTKRGRERLADVIQQTARAWGIGQASAAEIDRLGIVPATRLAMMRAIEATTVQADCLLIDGYQWYEMSAKMPVRSIIRGDSLSLSIAAASILAKVWRDHYMRKMALLYPHYHFDEHVGYGVEKHRQEIMQFGLCPLHRRSFRPMRDRLADED